MTSVNGNSLCNHQSSELLQNNKCRFFSTYEVKPLILLFFCIYPHVYSICIDSHTSPYDQNIIWHDTRRRTIDQSNIHRECHRASKPRTRVAHVYYIIKMELNKTTYFNILIYFFYGKMEKLFDDIKNLFYSARNNQNNQAGKAMYLMQFSYDNIIYVNAKFL